MSEMSTKYSLPVLLCTRCHHEWTPREPVPPKVCPRCKNPNWNTPKHKLIRKAP